jgi:hypothetical protein
LLKIFNYLLANSNCCELYGACEEASACRAEQENRGADAVESGSREIAGEKPFMLER